MTDRTVLVARLAELQAENIDLHSQILELKRRVDEFVLNPPRPTTPVAKESVDLQSPMDELRSLVEKATSELAKYRKAETFDLEELLK